MRFRLDSFVVPAVVVAALTFFACGDSSDGDKEGGDNAGGNTDSKMCDMQACQSCFSAGDRDCTTACEGCSDESDNTADSGSTSGPSKVPDPECTKTDECGISYECLSCGLNDGKGWCFQTKECKFDEDCGLDGKCGYAIETGAYRCLPADYCK